MNLTTNLAPQILTAVGKATTRSLVAQRQARGGGGGGGNGSPPHGDGAMVWVVFLLCLICSAVGVAFSFLLLAPRMGGAQMWAVGFVIAIVMLGISYGAKYANENARRTFTPVDVIQYLSQGFLWPSAWPALATFLGIKTTIAPPQTTWLFETIHNFLATVAPLAW